MSEETAVAERTDITEKRAPRIQRYFTEKIYGEGKTPYDDVEWISGKANILDDQGKVIFVQENVESPRQWSGLARDVVASKYFWGGKTATAKENSVKSLIGRVSSTIRSWSETQGYHNEEEAKAFEDELAYIALNQYASWNSPVWFNVGVDQFIDPNRKKEQRIAWTIQGDQVIPLPLGEEYKRPQTSACFIQSVKDTMEDIMALATKEAMLFKYGSGTGTDLSTLRSSKEKLSGGGEPSGPLAYLQFYDRVAGIVKSGGKTRRAAKMNSLKVVHPDIREFIVAKAREFEKMEMLMRAGVSKEEAATTVAYQNANLSVRATDKFMQAVEKDEEWQTIPVHNMDMADKMPKYKARDLLKLIAEGTHKCGDPGMQFEDTINAWHTCTNSGRINASNPCSEYMFLDNSACNLASTRLTKFLMETGMFDTEKYERVVRLMARSQDILIDNSSFPTKEIAENSHRFRPLGTGYADLGALVMSLGLPYDSDEARAVAAAITALHTGSVYLESTFLAEQKGTFMEYEKNKEPMLKVIEMHKTALRNIDKTKIPKGLENIIEKAEVIWQQVTERGRIHGFRNAQATNLAPTGTIGFMMDCDTTGIEPDMALVKYKELAGGGKIRIVNRAVKSGLKRLGYTDEEAERIVKYIDEKDTIEGAPGLREKDLPVFDCAYKPKQGTRIINYMGHIKMMASVQPFLSGAISKTVSMPENCTVADIEKAYTDSWRMGLKAVAIYRDGSRKDQPVSTSKDKNKPQENQAPVRRKLPTTRQSVTHKFNIADHEGYVIVGLYPDGRPGELFVSMNKEGSTMGGTMDCFGTAISLCLQYGVPLKDLCRKFIGQNYEPRGLVMGSDTEIKTAKSIIDYIFNWLHLTFPEKDPNAPVPLTTESPKNQPKKASQPKEEDEELGGFCPVCQDNTRLRKKGHCMEKCPVCNYINTHGCGE